MNKVGGGQKAPRTSDPMAEKITHKSEGANPSPLSESGIDMLENYTCLSPKCSFHEPRQPDDKIQCQLGCMFNVGGMVSADVSTASLWRSTREGNEQTEDRRLR